MKLAIFLALLIIESVVLVVGDNGNNCKEVPGTFTLYCVGSSVPASIPIGVNHVILKGIDLDIFHNGQFSHRSWNNTVTIHVYAQHGRILQSESFTGLDNLKELKLQGPHLRSLAHTSFHGLPLVERLDLSDNPFLNVDTLILALDGNINLTLPYLRWINLARVNLRSSHKIAVHIPIFGILSKRHIEHLDLSERYFLQLSFRNSSIGGTCEHLKEFVLKGATILKLLMDDTPTPCRALRLFDMRNLYSKALFDAFQFFTQEPSILIEAISKFFMLASNVDTLFLGNSYLREKVGKVNFTNVIFDLSPYLNNLRTIDISRSYIGVFNATIYLNNQTISSLREINFSDNVLEYISPRAIGVAANTERLNLSLNYLNKMNQNYPLEFRMLLNKLTKLKILGLAYNELTEIPYHMFINNDRLEYLDLSDNLLTHLDFKVNHLINLQVIDVSNNRLKVLQSTVLQQFREISNKQHLQNDRTANGKQITVGQYDKDRSYEYNKTDHGQGFAFENRTNEKLTVRIHGNPFECDCEREFLDSLEWITSSGLVHRNETKLTCTLNGHNMHIFPSALKDTKLYCLHVKAIKYGSIAVGIVVGITMFSVLVVFRLRQRFIKKCNIQTFVKQIQTGEKLKNLIFLSFCNEDGDFVLAHIYPKMTEEASRAIQCDRNLICCGDLDFRPGMSLCIEVNRCIEESAVVVFVVSNTFCQKGWCKMEVDTASAMRKPVILLMLEKVQLEVMTPHIRKLFDRYTRVTWVKDQNDGQNGGHPNPAWPVIISSAIELASSFNADNQTLTETGDDTSADDSRLISVSQESNQHNYNTFR